MENLLVLIYVVLGYWATGKTILANKIVVTHGIGELFLMRFMWGFCLGWLLIPVALIKKLLFKR